MNEIQIPPLTWKQRIVSLFWPQHITTITSLLSGTIQVVYHLGSYRLQVAGLTQSGGLVRTIWQQALDVLPQTFQPNKVLILGYGAGTVSQVIHNRWSNLHIIGIELDPVMIELGRQLNMVPNTDEIEIADAFIWIQQNLSTFDLIIVDVYQGNMLPDELVTEETISYLQQRLTNKGRLLINLVKQPQVMVQSTQLFPLVTNYFNSVEIVEPVANQIIIAKTQTNT